MSNDFDQHSLTPVVIAPRDPGAPRPTAAEIDAEMARIDGINGAAGHRLSDPHLRELLRKEIAGEISGDDFVCLSLEHVESEGRR